MLNNIFKVISAAILTRKIKNIKQIEHWVEGGSEQITEECKDLAAHYAVCLSDKFDLMPKRIAPSVENAISLKYVNKNKTMEIEVDNELDTVGVVSCGSKVLYSIEINNLNDLIEMADEYGKDSQLL
jgi:hypothetical protein